MNVLTIILIWGDLWKILLENQYYHVLLKRAKFNWSFFKHKKAALKEVKRTSYDTVYIWFLRDVFLDNKLWALLLKIFLQYAKSLEDPKYSRWINANSGKNLTLLLIYIWLNFEATKEVLGYSYIDVTYE